MNSDLQEKIKKNAISLKKYELNDLVWNQEDAQNIINLIMEDNVGILGGDVYRLQVDCVRSLYDNWACEPGEGESQTDFYFRSKIESLEYIKKYPTLGDKEIVFSITFTKEFQR